MRGSQAWQPKEVSSDTQPIGTLYGPRPADVINCGGVAALPSHGTLSFGLLSWPNDYAATSLSELTASVTGC
jgi:hypothetical protein